MGIFVQRKVKAGEELTFNYNVDRYGADPQPCYCGEPECVGFIGGKTQTGRATKLPALIVEALGIDGGDGWDTAVAKKPRRKRPDEDDEEYVNSLQAKSLDEDGARKVMAALMQCKEKWIAIKLLERIQKCDDNYVLNMVMRMHAYQIMKTMITSFTEDDNVIIQVLDVLDRMPRLTKNKIVDSNIEATVQGLKAPPDTPEILLQDTPVEKWRQLSLEKQKKIYENTIFPHIKYVLDKFRHKLPRDQLKRFAKDLVKKLVASDYKNDRVQDPTATLTDKQVKKVKSYVKDFLDRAVVKYREHEKKKAGHDSATNADDDGAGNGPEPLPASDTLNGVLSKEDSMVTDITVEAISSPEDGGSHTPGSPRLKRKRGEEDDVPIITPVDELEPVTKRVKELEEGAAETPPPPPPLPSARGKW
ncbi:unnamed protein product [Parascedosporium putredinis]|uniref:Histone-lysine N-methyltransferase, H3 lysine-36 specific n=1 Tax=Parascedosporium putredinis TaxID=1442378 RepID=A0A9P1GX34_9PEZI|nr:unnamed protein product [Parascedosporium putredinis]CAI7988661.1 unnamed protein product [Parascedosporium putredinis]